MAEGPTGNFDLFMTNSRQRTGAAVGLVDFDAHYYIASSWLDDPPPLFVLRPTVQDAARTQLPTAYVRATSLPGSADTIH